MKKKKEKKIPIQAERAKRGAAGTAHTTLGRSRIFDDRTKYNRKRGKQDDEGPDQTGSQ